MTLHSKELWLPVLTIVLLACSHAVSPSPSATPAPSTPGVADPCSIAGSCTVRMSIPSEAWGRLAGEGINFRVFRGCPHDNGFLGSDEGRVPFKITRLDPNTPRAPTLAVAHNQTMLGGRAVLRSTDTVIVLPATPGRIQTIGVFYRTDPGKYAVVDFGAGPDQTVTFGYRSTQANLSDDSDADNKNLREAHRLCP